MAFTYRVNVQAPSKMSPFELLYGVKARPKEMEASVADDEWAEPGRDDILEWAEVIRGKMAGDWQTATDNNTIAQGKQKKRYDIKRQKPVFGVGDACSDTTDGEILERATNWRFVTMGRL